MEYIGVTYYGIYWGYILGYILGLYIGYIISGLYRDCMGIYYIGIV